MNLKNNVIFLLATISFIIVIIRNSLLPGSSILMNNGNMAFLILFFALFIFLLDFNIISNFQVIYILKRKFLLIILFFVFVVSTFFFNIQEITKFDNLVRFISFLLHFFVFFILVPKFLFEEPDYIYKLVRFYSITSFIIAGWGLCLLFLGLNPPGQYSEFAHSIIVHPNYVAPLYVIGSVCTLYIYFSKLSSLTNIRRTFYLSAFIIQFVATLLSFSRNGIIALLLSVIVFFTLRNYRYILFMPFIVLSFPILFLGFFMTKGFSSLLSRLYLLIPAIEMMKSSKSNFYWGYGVTNTFKVYEDYMITYNVIEKDIQNPHNSFISLILMFGIIFFVVISIFALIQLIKGIYNSYKIKEPSSKLFQVFLVTIVITIIALGLFESQLVMTEFMCMQPFLIFLGLLFYKNRFTKIIE